MMRFFRRVSFSTAAAKAIRADDWKAVGNDLKRMNKGQKQIKTQLHNLGENRAEYRMWQKHIPTPSGSWKD